MTEMRIYAGGPGDSFTIHVECLDENGQHFTFPIEINVQVQDKPRLIGVRVMGIPVLLRSTDTVFHSGAVKE